jgi:hypothetical protein
MAIVASDIVKRLSVVTASAGDTTASTPAASLGDQVATTVITDATLNNLFDDVSGAEAAAGVIDYRCIFILNNHATLTLTTATIAILSQTAGGGTIDIATDNIGPVAKGSASAQAATIANETTAPTGVSAFGAGPLALGDLAPGQVKGVWLRRTVTAGASALNPDGVILRVTGDTLP